MATQVMLTCNSIQVIGAVLSTSGKDGSPLSQMQQGEQAGRVIATCSAKLLCCLNKALQDYSVVE